LEFRTILLCLAAATLAELAQRFNGSETAISHATGRLLRRQKPLKDK